MWTNPDSELWEWTFASVTLSVVLCMRILAAVSEKQSLPPLGSGICSEYWAFWKLRGIFRLGIFFFFFSYEWGSLADGSSGWIVLTIFAAFYLSPGGRNSGKASFSKDNGGKAHSANTEQQLQDLRSLKDTVPLAAYLTLLSCDCVLITGE